MLVDEIVQAIRHGQVSDRDLDLISEAVRRRRQRQGLTTLDELRRGTPVRIKGIGTGGKYLNGAEGVVTQVARTRVTVRLTKVGWNGTSQRQRFQVGTEVILHGHNVEPITEGETLPMRDLLGYDAPEDIGEGETLSWPGGMFTRVGPRNVTPEG